MSPLILSVIIFALLDPFLWIMPAKHIADMIYRITFHYFEYQGPNLSHSLTFHLSIVAIVSVLLALISIFDKRRESSAPRLFVLGLTTLSIFWYAVFLTSHSQALRYFQPIIMIWEMLLGLFLFNMLSQVEFKFLHSEQAKNRAQTIVFVMATFIVSLRAILIFGAWYMQ